MVEITYRNKRRCLSGDSPWINSSVWPTRPQRKLESSHQETSENSILSVQRALVDQTVARTPHREAPMKLSIERGVTLSRGVRMGFGHGIWLHKYRPPFHRRF